MKFYPFCIQCGELIAKVDPYIGKGFCNPWCWTEHLRIWDYDSQADFESYKDDYE